MRGRRCTTWRCLLPLMQRLVLAPMPIPMRRLKLLILMLTSLVLPGLSLAGGTSSEATTRDTDFAAVVPGKALTFPRDHGAHPDFRTEWWYVTGWLETPEGKPMGFQVTFFRSATGHDRRNPSRFAPRQLIIAHAALSDPADGRLRHDQKIARAGFGLAGASEADTNLKLGRWTMRRDRGGDYAIDIPARDFRLQLSLSATQPLMLQGQAGYSRKGPRPEQASHYYSQPQLRVSGKVTRAGQSTAMQGSAWLDHEWSSTVLDPSAVGWDWAGINLDDGAALMAFRIRDAKGTTLWSHAALRDKHGRQRIFGGEQVRFAAQRQWRSPRTGASYPVAVSIDVPGLRWTLEPLQEDQELDSRLSTGAVYWEGAVRVLRDGQPAGRGYLELTGYLKALKL